MKRILMLPKVRLHNANALSSPFTIGIPAMTAWLGAVHALQRHLNNDASDSVTFLSAGIVCHSFDLQTYRGPGDFVHSIIGTGNPLDKNGDRPAFIEAARCHLTVSIIIEYQGIPVDDEADYKASIGDILQAKMKMAGGDILSFNPPEFLKIDGIKTLGMLKRRLMPGYILIERRELMKAAMNDGRDALDALLDHVKVMHRSERDATGKVVWNSRRKTNGWIVPIATGFHGISELGKAKNQRDSDTPHRFAESVVTLGEFIMPYRIQQLDDVLWKYTVDGENNLYLCEQKTNATT